MGNCRYRFFCAIVILFCTITACENDKPPIQRPDGTWIVSRAQLDMALLDIQANSGLYSFGRWIGPSGDCEIRAIHLQTAVWDAFAKQGINSIETQRQIVWAGEMGHMTVAVMTTSGMLQIDPNTGDLW
jgi:hypothetical protein